MRPIIMPLILLIFSSLVFAGQVKSLAASRYVFTDEKLSLPIPDAVPEVAYTLTTITENGWGPTATGKLPVKDCLIQVSPLTEGIHILKLALPTPLEVRFLAMAPPPPIDRHALRLALPHTWKKLLGNQDFCILAMGDSITNTGDYLGMLGKMLARATGNQHLRLVNKSYPGRSVDATVRNFPVDIIPNHPDLGLLMYGMNDFRAGCALDGYLDQYRWVAEHMASDCQGDTVFLTPTPDISMGQDFTTYDAGIFQIMGFASPLIPLAARLKVPLADTFHAVWGKGAGTVDASGKAMWPKYPPNYDKQLLSIIENGGKGDGVHANALGHLAIAKAVYQSMMGKQLPQPLSFTATSEWTPEGLVSQVKLRNTSNTPREGIIRIYPLPTGDVRTDLPEKYSLAPNAEVTFHVTWTQMTKPDDLLKYPANMYIAPWGRPEFAAIDFSGQGSTIYAVPAPMLVEANFVRERQVVVGNAAVVHFRQGKKTIVLPVEIPKDAEVGRIPLLRKVTQGTRTGWAAAELAYVRYGAAEPGEATVDGSLDEWAKQRWIPVGEPVQARWTQGVSDGRATPQECYLHWAFKAGQHGIYMAIRATGQVTNDTFTLFFDTRAPALLGTPGRYYWVSGNCKNNGQMALGKGETSQVATGLTGAWKTVVDGATIELFIPYDLMELQDWPRSGDLGLSIWWRHTYANGNPPTNIQWSEDGHPWNTRWYGVVRRTSTVEKPLPYMVRVK